IQQSIFGVVLGSYLAVATIGFTLMYGVLDLLNLAYGEYLTFGGLLAWFLIATESIPPYVAVPIVIVATALFALVIGRVFFRSLKNAGPIPLILTSIGVSFFLRNGFRFGLGSNLRLFEYREATVFNSSALGGFFVNTQQLTAIGLALLSFVLIHLLLTRTKTGIAMRAVSGNESLSQVTGIDTDQIRNYVVLLAGALAGLSGYLLATQRGVTPNTGFTQLLFVVSAAILGGSGSAYGAIAGSYLIGLTIAFSVAYLPGGASLGTVLAFLVLVAVLLVRPGGIANVEVAT
ncbi:MAG: branched-chain amino acid ABC transporter permease, partial [Haloferacaceae archaeon]